MWIYTLELALEIQVNNLSQKLIVSHEIATLKVRDPIFKTLVLCFI